MAEEIFEKINRWIDDKKVFVCYKKPQSDVVECLIQNNSNTYITGSLSKEGFVMAPFDNSRDSFIIPLENSSTEQYKINKNPVLSQPKDVVEIHKFIKQKYLKLIQNTVEYIKSGQAQKIVISRTSIQQIENHSIANIFDQLSAHYDNAMVYLWHHPTIGLWIGATPERLVTYSNQSFATMSLAGTQTFRKNITWLNKEIEEQAIVTRYITEKLKPICKSIKQSDTYSKKAGHLAHLCTDISGELNTGTTIDDLAEQLHPTPAVCGVPQEVAQEFILKNESHDRSFYTGYLGMITHEQSELFVNLRCMQINDNQATIYVGGGITADSDPEKEWLETVEKSKVLGHFLV